MLGGQDDLGKLLGVNKDWLVKAIEAVGIYGEIFDRHFGEKSVVKMARGPNALSTKGGLMYPMPLD